MSSAASYCSKRTFGDLLSWHLFENGTRPGCSPTEAGEVWEKSQFAFAVGTSVRNIDNWVANKHFPRSTRSIEKSIFGYSKSVDVWRKELREQFIKSSRNNNKIAESENVKKPVRNTVLSRMPPRTEAFTGRSLLLTAIDNILRQQDKDNVNVPSRCCVIHGLGGSGKSALASEYAHLSIAKYEGIWWCDAQGDEQLWSGLARLGETLSPIIANDQNLKAKAEQTILLLQRQSKDGYLFSTT